MKRIPLPPRKKPLRKSGPTKAKKVIRQKKFYASAAWKRLRKVALERAGHTCQFEMTVIGSDGTPEIWCCQDREHLEIHHLTNARFGGQELPEDLLVLCRYHHRTIEARDFPYRQRKWV